MFKKGVTGWSKREHNSGLNPTEATLGEHSRLLILHVFSWHGEILEALATVTALAVVLGGKLSLVKLHCS